MNRVGTLGVHKLMAGGLFVCIAISLCVTPLAKAGDSDNSTLAPAAPTEVNAKVTGGGVKIEWQASQPGSNDIAQYVVERSDGDENFTAIATVPHDQRGYLDTEGNTDQHYRLKALDNSDPALGSEPSDVAVAIESNQKAAPGPDSKTQITSPLDGLSIPDLHTSADLIASSVANLDKSAKQIDSLTDIPPAELSQKATDITNHQVDSLKKSLFTGKTDMIEPLLSMYQTTQQTIITRFDQLSPQQQQDSKQSCARQDEVLQLILLLLPDEQQSAAIGALATCEVISQK